MRGQRQVGWIHRIPLTLAAIGVLALLPPAHAQPTMAQYSVAAWGHKDGLPSTFIYSITQTDDGFLWLGTKDGLVRFDGVQFTPWRAAMPNGQLAGQVRTLNISREGDLLLGTGAGLVGRIRNGVAQITQLHAAAERIGESRDGSLWVATTAALLHLGAATLQPLDPPISLPGERLSGPQQGSDGQEWITTTGGIFYVQAGRLVQTSHRRAWLVARGGGIAWLDQQGRLHSLRNQAMASRSGELLPHSRAITDLMEDSAGCLWIATRGHGIFRMSNAGGHAAVQQFTRRDGLSSDFIRAIFEDTEHNLWVATENGLDRLRRNNVLSLTRRDGLFSDAVTSIAAGSDGSVWMATPEGLERLLNGQATVYRRSVRILSLLAGRDGELWAGSTAGLLQWRGGHELAFPKGRTFTAVTTLAQDGSRALWFFDADKGLFQEQPGHDPVPVTNPSLQQSRVSAMASGPGDAVWLGLDDGNIVEEQHGAFHSYTAQDGLSGGTVHCLSVGPGGKLWAATERGLCTLADKRFNCANARSGLPGDRVLWALPDAHGKLWLGYNVGVARMDATQLQDASQHGASKLDSKFFDDADGIANSPDLIGNAPAAFALDGRLWLTTSQGVAVLDPEHLPTNILPPPVSILGLQADGQLIDISRPIRLRPLTRSIQFSFTGLSLTVPRKMRFRYRLDGFDHDWHDGGADRDASYTNLPPGRYTFRVLAANNDGVWNNTGAALSFQLAPAYFQTLWFRLLCLAAVVLTVGFLIRLRLRSAKRIMRLRFEERMEERSCIAQQLHDHLIQEMVGISMQLEVADELTAGSADAKTPLQRALTLSRSAIASGRLTLQSLRSRPVTGSALMEMLRQTAEAYPQKRRTAVEYRINGNERLLRAEIAEDLSELGQEALRNALRHAGHTDIRVDLRYGLSSLELVVGDRGPGIAEAVLRTGMPGHYGLAGMRERAARMTGEFSIESSPGQGTTVRVSIPAGRAYQDRQESGFGATKRSEPQGKIR